MSIQVLAVRVADGNDLFHITELIYRDDDDGKLGYMERARFAEWVNDHPTKRVYLRDHVGNNVVVMSFVADGERFLRTQEDISTRDLLLRLPRYITETKKVTSSEVPVKNEYGLWWFWWLPR
jgi:hypothetical protein